VADETKGFLGGKYQSQEAFEEAYKNQDREVQRLQTELEKQGESLTNLQPIAEILNRPGGLDAVETYIKNGAPSATPEVDPYEGLPDEIGDMDKKQFMQLMQSRESQLRSQFEAQAKQMVNEAIGGERSRSQSADAERSFRERHGVQSQEDFERFKQYANGVSRVDLQDTLYQKYVDSLGGPQGSHAKTREASTPQPNLPQGAGMGAGEPATSMTSDQEFLAMRRQQLLQPENEALAVLKGAFRS